MFAAGGQSQADIGRSLGVSHQTVSDWHSLWKRGGTEALRAAGRAGRRPKLTARQLAEVEAALRKGPEGKRLWHRSVDTGPGGRGHRGGYRCQLSPGTCLAGSSRTARLDPPEAGTPGDRARRRGNRAMGDQAVAEGNKSARRRGALIVFQMRPGAYNDESLIEFLTEMHTLLEDRLLTLIWDGLASHPQPKDERVAFYSAFLAPGRTAPRLRP